jgi:hypothetical protein
MKKMVVTLACVLIVPLAFAQTSSTGKGQKGQGATTTTEPITVTGTIISMTTEEEGTAASYQPVKTLVVREDSSNKPGTYVIRGPGRVMNRAGQPIRTAIKPGTRVRVYYANIGNSRVVDHVMVE